MVPFVSWAVCVGLLDIPCVCGRQFAFRREREREGDFSVSSGIAEVGGIYSFKSERGELYVKFVAVRHTRGENFMLVRDIHEEFYTEYRDFT